ncbi:MAG: hypothetical protein ACP5SH_24245 [Syntrophobacteraceae bacterium]
MVEIDSLAVSGELRAFEIADAIQWAGNHQQELMQEWSKWHP